MKLEDFNNAVAVQDACNVTAVLNSLANVIREVRKELYANALGEQEVRRHPIVQAYMFKVCDMMHFNLQQETVDELMAALEICKLGIKMPNTTNANIIKFMKEDKPLTEMLRG